jgi:hypothetical protein
MNNTPRFEKAEFESFFRRDAHHLFYLGYQKVRPQIDSTMKEPTITLEIYEAIKEVLRSLDLPDEIANRNYHAKAEDPRKHKGGTIFLDILIVNNQYLEYTFEAKRLRKKGYPIGKYCGKDGLIRFVTQKYCSEQSEVVMVGFMQSDDAAYWSSEIERTFKGDTTGAMGIETEFAAYPVIPEITNEWASTHRRSKNGNIKVFHILLDAY